MAAISNTEIRLTSMVSFSEVFDKIAHHSHAGKIVLRQKSAMLLPNKAT